MYMKEVTSLTFYKGTNIKEITDEGIFFENGLCLTHHHDQDCCENVYANWEIYQRQFDGIKDIARIEISTLENSGIVLEFYGEDEYLTLNKWFIPCYDEQNGYYSNNLHLNFGTVDGFMTIDITGCTKFFE